MMQYPPDNQSNGSAIPGQGGQQVYPPQQYPQPPVAQTVPPVNHGYGAPQVIPPQQNSSFVQQATAVPQVDSSKKIPDRKSVATKLIELTYLFLIILESILALRFIFKLLGANPENPFIQFLYQATLVFTFPFTTLFNTPIQNNISVSSYSLEFTTLVAIGVYALIAYIIVRIIDIFR